MKASKADINAMLAFGVPRGMPEHEAFHSVATDVDGGFERRQQKIASLKSLQRLFRDEDRDRYQECGSFEEACAALAEMVRRFELRRRAIVLETEEDRRRFGRGEWPRPGALDTRSLDIYGFGQLTEHWESFCQEEEAATGGFRAKRHTGQERSPNGALAYQARRHCSTPGPAPRPTRRGDPMGAGRKRGGGTPPVCPPDRRPCGRRGRTHGDGPCRRLPPRDWRYRGLCQK